MILRPVDPTVSLISQHLMPWPRRARGLTALANLGARMLLVFNTLRPVTIQVWELLMTRKSIYLAFCVLGIVLPYSQFLPWVVAQHGVPLGLFVHELFANRIGGFFGMDVLVSAVVLLLFVRREARRLGVRHLWL